MERSLQPLRPQIDTIYFDGAAWGIMYYMQMFDTIDREIVRGNVSKNARYYTTSSGALAVLFRVVKMSTNQSIDWFHRYRLDSSKKIISGQDGISLSQYQIKVLEEIIEFEPRAYLMAMEYGLVVGITTERTGFQWIDSFDSNEDLMNVLLCSFHIPLMSTYDARYRGEIAVDGGIGFNIEKFFPTKDPNTKLTITTCESPNFNINGSVPRIFCLCPTIEAIARHYTALGNSAILKYFNHRNRDTAPREIDRHRTNGMLAKIPAEVFWFLRAIQPIDRTIADLHLPVEN